MDKHPETLLADNPGRATALQDDSQIDWDRHVAETYYFYWGQYTYWAAQGWTTDLSASNINTTGEVAAAVMKDKGIETHPEEWRNRSQQREEALYDDVEGLNHHFRENCTLETDGSGETCGTDQPHNGENSGKRPATSSQDSVAQHPGGVFGCGCSCTDYSEDFFRTEEASWMRIETMSQPTSSPVPF